jgi:hypothetical protein
VTRDQIAEDLLTIVLTIGNELPPPSAAPRDPVVPADVRLAEWSYVKGLASFAIMQLRDRLLDADRTLADLAAHATAPSRRADVDATSQTVVDTRRGRRP